MLSRTERFLLIAFIVASALAFRVPRLYTEWPFQFVQEVQLTSALAARNLWLTHYKKDLTVVEKKWVEQRIGRFIEPPLLPHLVAASYAIAGEEIPWVASLFTAFFWLIGGIFVYRLARFSFGEEMCALASAAFFLLTPYGILLSMSFQPEALMILGYIISIDVILRNPVQRSWRDAVRVTTVAGLCALAKPGAALLPVYTTFLAVGLTWKDKIAFFKNRKNLFFLLLTPIPSIVYLVCQLGTSQLSTVSPSGDNLLGSLLSIKLFEQFLLLPTIPQYVATVVGYGAFGFSAISVALWSSERVKRIYVGLLLGYLGNTILFFKPLGDLKTYKLFASYYHWPLILPTALGVGCGVSYLFRCIRWSELPQKSRAAFMGMGLATLLVLAAPCMDSLERPAVPDTTLYQVIDRVLPRGERAIALTPYLAQDARYYNWLITQNWLQEMKFRELILEEKLVELELKLHMIVERTKARYLILVVRDKDGATMKLSWRLSKLPKVISTPRLIIYDVSSWIPTPDIIRTARDYMTQVDI